MLNEYRKVLEAILSLAPLGIAVLMLAMTARSRGDGSADGGRNADG
jgi:hypothetical protein